MSKKLFTDALSDETIVNLTDQMLKHKISDKPGKKIKSEFIKIIPAVAAIALVIGLINIFSTYSSPGLEIGGGRTPGSEAGVIGRNEVYKSDETDKKDETITDVFTLYPAELEYYTYDEYLKQMEKDKALFKLQINCTNENWMPVAGQPVLTQEIYDEQMVIWDEYIEKTLELIQKGAKISKRLSDYTSAVYDKLDPHLDLKCGIDKNGNWVLYNYDGTSDIYETFVAKDEMLERARWWLSRGTMAGEVDMAQANAVYRGLYFADAATVEVLPNPNEGDNIVNTLPLPQTTPEMRWLAYERGYRDSPDYTKFVDSAFFRRLNDNTLSEEESKNIYKSIYAGAALDIADDIINMQTYDTGDKNLMGIMLELEDGNIAKFEIDIPEKFITP